MRSVEGNVSPSSLAVLRLMIRSNFRGETGRLCAPKDAIDVVRQTSIYFDQVLTIAREAAAAGEKQVVARGRQPPLGRELADAIPLGKIYSRVFEQRYPAVMP